MTRLGPPQIIACPTCESLQKKQSFMSWSSFGATLWSDGYLSSIGISPGDGLAYCAACQRAFWLADAPTVGRMSTRPLNIPRSRLRQWIAKTFNDPFGDYDAKAEAAWNALPEEWKHAPNVQPLRDTQYVDALAQGIAKTPEQEIYLRKLIWQRNNHQDRGSKTARLIPEDQARSNMEQLLDLLKIAVEAERDTLCIAELHRHLGHFQEAIDIINQSDEKDSPPGKCITLHAMEKNIKVQEVWREGY